ncbi:MAG: RHS repeat-associated core domain-containing protein, partial [Planctomycetota bacterium]
SEDADPASGQRYYLFTDQRGCPEKVVDDAGDTVWEAYVEPYGTAHVLKGHDFYQPLRFPGHWWDPELGLHYNRFRYYSPWLGRYLQVDRIGEQGGMNVYAYCDDSPLAAVDVRGLNKTPSECGGGGGQPGPEREDGGDAAGQPDPTATRTARQRELLEQRAQARRRQIEAAELDSVFQRNRRERDSGQLDRFLDPADRAFISDDRQLRRASDTDRGLRGRGPGSAVDEARAMDHAERTGQLDPPVERSVRPGADVRSAADTPDERHWSMKGVGEPSAARSRTRAAEEAQGLASLRRRGDETPGLLVDLRHSQDPRGDRESIQRHVDQLNADLAEDGYAPVDLAFIER